MSINKLEKDIIPFEKGEIELHLSSKAFKIIPIYDHLLNFRFIFVEGRIACIKYVITYNNTRSYKKN